MASTLLTRDLRAIRRVAPPDAPCEATLAVLDGVAFLLIDSENELPGRVLAYTGAEHVWAPIDLWRRSGGHDMMMPRVVESLEMFLERRRGATVPAGEIVTLACSVLRGNAEIGVSEPSHPVTGRWWVTDSGRPVFVVVPGDTALVASTRMLAMLAEHADDRELVRGLTEATRAVAEHDEEAQRESERRLVQIAAPRPVDIAVLGARLESGPLVAPPSGAVPRRRSAHERPQPARGAAPLALVRESASARLVEAREWCRERLHRSARRGSATMAPSPSHISGAARTPASAPRQPARKRLWGFAIVLAMLIVVVGVLWPDADQSPPASSDGGVHRESADTSAVPAAAGADSVAQPSPVDTNPVDTGPVVPQPEVTATAAIVAGADQPEITRVAAALFAAAADCEAAQSCDALFVDPALAALVPSVGVVTLIDDYGGIAVFAVTPAEPGAVAVTVAIEQRDDQWMIREVYDSKGN